MRNFASVTTLLMVLSAISSPMSSQQPDPQPPVVGVWTLKSIKVAGTPVKAAPDVLKDLAGGLELGDEWRFRKFEDDNGGAVLSEKDCGYEYLFDSRELVVDREAKDVDVKQIFDVKVTGKTMRLRFREKKKPVELTFEKQE